MGSPGGTKNSFHEDFFKGAFGEFAGFYRWDASKQAGRTRLFFCDQADLKRYSRLKNQSANIDASGSAGFFFVSEHPKKK